MEIRDVSRDAWTLAQQDCWDWLPSLPDGTLDAVVTDPPYHIGTAATNAIMPWDRGDIAFDPTFWAEVRRATAKGGHLAAFGHPRISHRLATAIEDAGWVLTEPIYWAHAHIIRKHSHALTPGATPIVVARNRGRAGYAGIESATMATGSIAKTLVLSHAQGCEQVGWSVKTQQAALTAGEVRTHYKAYVKPHERRRIENGRLVAPVWSCVDGCPVGEIESQQKGASAYFHVLPIDDDERNDTAVFYAPRPAGKSLAVSNGTRHPTQKPLSLMTFLVRLLSTEGQLVGDPFAGSATTGVAALQSGRRFAGCERDPEFHRLAEKRLSESDGVCLGAGACSVPTFGDLVGRLFDPDSLSC